MANVSKRKTIKFLIIIFSLNLFIFAIPTLFTSLLLEGNDVETEVVKILEAKPQPKDPEALQIQYLSMYKKTQIKVPILMYHNLKENPNPRKYPTQLFVSEEMFTKQIEYLRMNGYHTILVRELADAFEGKFRVPPKAVVLTFDDGYIDHYNIAFRELQKHNMKATFYIPTYILDTHNEHWLNEAQLLEIADSGMEVGSHTLSHAYLTKIPSDQLISELLLSKQELESITGNTVFTISYPGCMYNGNVLAETQRAGFVGGVTCGTDNIQRANERFFLKRRVVTNNFEEFKRFFE